MCDKMAISAYILKIVVNDPFLSIQIRAKEMFQRNYGFLKVSEKLWLFNHKRADFWLPNFGFKRSGFSASLNLALYSIAKNMSI